MTALVDSAPVGAAVLDPDLRYRWVNQTLCTMNGHSADEHLGRLPQEVLGPLGEELEAVLRRVLSGDGSLVDYRFRGQRPGVDGHWMASYYPLRNETGEIVAVGAIVTDITEHERGSERERQFLNALVRVAQTVAGYADSREVLAVVAREAAAVLELDGALIAAFRPGGIVLEGRWGEVAEVAGSGELIPTATSPLIEEVRRSRRPQRLVTESPDAFAFRSRIAAPIVLGDRLWGAIKVGTSVRRELPADAEEVLTRFAELMGIAVASALEQRRLIDEATHDPLTGICNRRAFQQRIRNESQRARRHSGGFSLVLLDIDDFKGVNDSYGHDVGDEVLIETTRRLRREVRTEDLLARVGGEEFAWILTDSRHDALLAAERARRAIANTPFELVGEVTLSAGVASFNDAGDPATLFRQADRALYEAKRRGRNRSVRYSDLESDAASAPNTETQRAREAEQAHALSALRALARAIDAKDAATFHHSERVAQLAKALAHTLGWPAERILALGDAALLHDVGKIGIPTELLLKPGELTVDEYELIKTHARLSCQIAQEVVTAEQAAWILHHHERWDGHGYPVGLSGEEIPDGAQLLAIADAWDAMTVARPYAHPLSPTEAMEECRAAAGHQFAPAAVSALQVVEARDPAQSMRS